MKTEFNEYDKPSETAWLQGYVVGFFCATIIAVLVSWLN